MAEGRSPLANAAEVSAYLGVPVNTIYQWRYRGVGPRAVRVGRYLRFRWEDVDHWLEQQGAETANPRASHRGRRQGHHA